MTLVLEGQQDIFCNAQKQEGRYVSFGTFVLSLKHMEQISFNRISDLYTLRT